MMVVSLVYMASDTYGGRFQLEGDEGGELQSFFGNCQDKYMDGHCWKKAIFERSRESIQIFSSKYFLNIFVTNVNEATWCTRVHYGEEEIQNTGNIL